MFRQKAVFLCVVWLVLGAERAFSADRFVSSSDGNDWAALNDCLERSRPCKTIAQALARARPGDTIRVMPGAPYLECGLVIDKPLAVVSEGGRAIIEPDAALDGDSDKTCRGGNVAVFKISGERSKGSSIEGFSLRGRIKAKQGLAVLILQETANVVIKNNIIAVTKEAGDETGSGIGLLIINSAHNQIENNEIQGVKRPKNEEGIRLQQDPGRPVSEGNLFRNNRIFNHGGPGIQILDVVATRPNLFVGNYIENNDGGGVKILSAAGLRFGGDRLEERNQIINNQESGLDFRGPCVRAACGPIEVIQNVLSHNGLGISFSTVTPGIDARFQRVRITNNTIQNNKGIGLRLIAGVYRDIVVVGNVIQLNEGPGVELDDLKSESQLELSRNTVRFQKSSGLLLKMSGQLQLAVQDNIVTDNEDTGMVLQLEQAQGELRVSGNVSSRNKKHGFDISSSSADASLLKTVSGNTAEYNQEAGFSFQGDQYRLLQNVIRRNLLGVRLKGRGSTIEDSEIASNHCTGLEISEGEENEILRNTFSLNGLSCPSDQRGPAGGHTAGILLRSTGSRNAFSFNTIQGNSYGISLLSLAGDREANIFTCNAITRNTLGIQVLPAQRNTPIPDRFHRNNIEGNAQFGLRNFSDTPVDVRSNWWGHAAGPQHELNPTGKGDRILGPANFSNPASTAIALRSCVPKP